MREKHTIISPHESQSQRDEWKTVFAGNWKPGVTHRLTVIEDAPEQHE